MKGRPKAQVKTTIASKPSQPKPAIRLDDLIPNEKVLGGRSVTFGIRAKPTHRP